MNLGETLGKFTDWVTGSLIGDDGGYEDITEFEPDFGRQEYVTDRNLAVAPAYEEHHRRAEKTRDNVKTLPNANYKNHEVRIVEPRSFGDTTQIVQQLLDGKTVILNLHLLDKETAQKTIDFVCGATFAIGGKPQKIGDTVFVFTPNSVQLSVESKENNAFGSESLWGGL